MYRYTDHARKRMLSRGISEEEIHDAIEKGEIEFTKKDEIGRGTEGIRIPSSHRKAI